MLVKKAKGREETFSSLYRPFIMQPCAGEDFVKASKLLPKTRIHSMIWGSHRPPVLQYF